MGWHLFSFTFQYFVAFVLVFTISFYIFAKNPKNKAYQGFFGFGLCMAVWLIAVFICRNAPSKFWAIQLYRVIGGSLMLIHPLLLLSLLFLRKEKKIYILTLLPAIILSASIVLMAPYNVIWTELGWSYTLWSPMILVTYSLLSGYILAVVILALFLTKKTSLKVLQKKYLLISTGSILYISLLLITNYLIYLYPTFLPVGGALAVIEFLFIAYAITLPVDKIEIIKPTGLTNFYCSFLNTLQNVIPGKELGDSSLKFTDYIEAMGLTDIVVFKGGKLIFDSAKFAEEEIGDVADTVLRTLKGLPELKDTVEQYTKVFIETYKTMMLISKNDADKWLEQMLHAHGGFLYQHGILDAMPEKIEIHAIFKELQPRKVYLFKEELPKEAYSKLKEALNWGVECLCVTKLHPQKVRERYGVEKASIFWLTFKKSNTEKTINPRHLDELSKAISKFANTTSGSAILIDCFREIIMVNGFERATSFLKGVKEICKGNNSNLLISTDPKMFEEKQMETIEKVMEEVK